VGHGREILLFPTKIDFGKLREANMGSAREQSGGTPRRKKKRECLAINLRETEDEEAASFALAASDPRNEKDGRNLSARRYSPANRFFSGSFYRRNLLP